jgi:hypothetical protein
MNAMSAQSHKWDANRMLPSTTKSVRPADR